MEKLEEKIKYIFLELLKEKNINNIDVSLISEKLNISRQSFYYHYKDIGDLITSILLDNEILYKKEFEYKTIIKSIIDYLFKNKEFNLTLLKSKYDYILIEFIFYYLNSSLLSYFKFFYRNKIKDENKIIISRILSNLISEESCTLFLINKNKEFIYNKILNVFNKDLIELLDKNINK